MSIIICTFNGGCTLDGAAAARQEFVAKRHLWRFGLMPDEIAALLREYGWTEREQVAPAEYAERYLGPLGRDLTVSQIELFVYADRPADEAGR